MENLPVYISLLFIICAGFTLFCLYKAAGNKFLLAGIIVLWLILQAWLASRSFYLESRGLPPRFILMILPPFLFIFFLFATRAGRRLMNNTNAQWLYWLHAVRIPVELVLFWLFVHRQVPGLMTFEGRNFDIFSGVTAPFVVLFMYNKKSKGARAFLLGWNLICLLLLFNIMGNSFLSAPGPFQKFAFDQPNIAVMHFPFVWLPAFIVPAVLFSHLFLIRKLVKELRGAGPELSAGSVSL